MQVSIFRKKKTDKNGREYFSYFTKIAGEFYDVRFSEQRKCLPPECDYPCNIEVQPGAVSVKEEVLKEGNHAGETFRKLYVYDYTMGDKFVDHSADYLFDKK